MQPKHKRRKSHRVDDGKKSKDTEDDNKKNNSKDRKPQGNSTQTSEPVKSEVGKEPKGDSYPAKRTGSSGPVMWDCPFCEDKKYTDNLEYLVHLQNNNLFTYRNLQVSCFFLFFNIYKNCDALFDYLF